MSKKEESLQRVFGQLKRKDHKQLEEVYIELYRLLVHITDHGKIEGGTPQSRSLIDQVKQLGEIVGADYKQIKERL